MRSFGECLIWIIGSQNNKRFLKNKKKHKELPRSKDSYGSVLKGMLMRENKKSLLHEKLPRLNLWLGPNPRTQAFH